MTDGMRGGGRAAAGGLIAGMSLAVFACAPTAAPTQETAACVRTERDSMIVRLTDAQEADTASRRDRVLAEVFGADGYRLRGSEGCAGPVLDSTFSSIPAFSMLLSEAEAARLRAHPDVRAVAPDALSAPQ